MLHPKALCCSSHLISVVLTHIKGDLQSQTMQKYDPKFSSGESKESVYERLGTGMTAETFPWSDFQ